MSDAGRGQLSLSAVEAGIGVIFILAVTMTFALGVPSPDTREAQLDAYASDTATVLAGEPPRHRDVTRLAEILDSRRAFERERDPLKQRIDRILPDNLLFQVTTPHGTVGYRKPAGVAIGTATVVTVNGEATIRVWYA